MPTVISPIPDINRLAASYGAEATCRAMEVGTILGLHGLEAICDAFNGRSVSLSSWPDLRCCILGSGVVHSIDRS